MDYDAVAESGRISGLARDGAAEPISRVQTLRRGKGQDKKRLPVQLTTIRVGNHTRDPYSIGSVDSTHKHTHTCIHTYMGGSMRVA